MKTLNGKYFLLYTKVGDDYIAIGCDRQTSLTYSSSLLKVTNLENSMFPRFIPDEIQWNISGSGLVLFGSKNTFAEMEDKLLTISEVNFKLVTFDTDGYIIRQGKGYINSLSLNGNTGGSISYSYSIQGNDDMDIINNIKIDEEQNILEDELLIHVLFTHDGKALTSPDKLLKDGTD